MNAATDRRVHARGSTSGPNAAGGDETVELVRYDRGGKWWIEGPCIGRRNVSFAAAVDIAETIARNGGQLFFGLPGGKRFDHRLEDYR